MSFVGKYERVKAENYEQFLQALGVNILMRKAATVSTPVMEVSRSRLSTLKSVMVDAQVANLHFCTE